MIIGVSTHNLEDITFVNSQLVDYLGFGPIFESTTKSGHAPVTGLARLQEAVQIAEKPLVAIGGITLERAREVYAAGASSVAVIQDLQGASSVAERVKAYQQVFEEIHKL